MNKVYTPHNAGISAYTIQHRPQVKTENKRLFAEFFRVLNGVLGDVRADERAFVSGWGLEGLGEGDIAAPTVSLRAEPRIVAWWGAPGPVRKPVN